MPEVTAIPTLNVTLNGQSHVLADHLSIQDALNQWFEGQDIQSVAVAVNGVFVPKSQHGDTQIHDGDDIECVSPMQGG